MPEIQIEFPKLHADQIRAYALRKPSGHKPRFKAIRCGRRWGKTWYGRYEAMSPLMRGQPVGWFAPTYKMIAEVYDEFITPLTPIKASGSSKQAGVIKLLNGGRIDFWSLENDNAGRSRSYALSILDEAAFGKPNMMDIWKRSIEPTLLDYTGRCLALSNTRGDDSSNFFWQLCKNPEHGFMEFHAPSYNNPTIPKRLPGESLISHVARRQAVFDKLRSETDPLVFAQEYEAEFVDWSGKAFFELEKLLVLGQGIDPPTHCGTVYATIDTATKTGKENDGTAVVYWALTPEGQGLYRLVILDWDVIQIDGAFLEVWLKTVFENLEHWAKICGARAGSSGAWIEDKASGMVLIQQAQNRGWPAHAIDSKLTALGKVERCMNVSGYVYRGLVKFTQAAYDKTITYKGTTANHLLKQILAFRVDDKDPNRQDDALDCFSYSLAIALGSSEGF